MLTHYLEREFPRWTRIEAAPGNRSHGAWRADPPRHRARHQPARALLLVAGPVYAIDGEVEIDCRDFGLAPIRRFGVITVEPRLVVRFHLQGRLAGQDCRSDDGK